MCNRFVLLLLFLSTVMITSKLQSQLVQIGPSDPNFCEKAEHLTPNLIVTEIARISGTLIDDSGAPFKTFTRRATYLHVCKATVFGEGDHNG